MLSAPVHEVQHLKGRFPEDTLDEVWLPQVAAETGLIIVSADPAITKAKKEREIWRRTGLTSFFFGGGFAGLSVWPQIAEVVNWWPEIVREAKGAQEGTGFLLPLRGSKKGPRLIYEPFTGDA